MTDTTVTILPKGGSVNIKEKAPSAKDFRLGAGWDVADQGGKSYDLDISAVLLNAAGKIVNKDAVVYYGNLDQPGVHHKGDNLTGAGEGDDEQIEVRTEKLDPLVEKIAFIVNIYDAKSKGQLFGAVNNSFVRIVNMDDDKELARHDLKAEYANMTGVFVASLVRNGGNWKFEANAQGVNGSIDEILKAENWE